MIDLIPGEPQPGDMIVKVEFDPWNGKAMGVWHEPWKDFTARHLLAHPRTLISYALRIYWLSLKRRLFGLPPVDRYTRVSDVLAKNEEDHA